MPFDQQQFDVETPVVDTVLDNLVRARALITSEDHWCINQRDDGKGRHCALGALDFVNGVPLSCDNGPAVKLLARYAEGSGWPGIPENHECFNAGKAAWHNNTLGHAATLRMFDRAIAARRAEIGA
jgi:hypothetical protein